MILSIGLFLIYLCFLINPNLSINRILIIILLLSLSLNHN